MGMKRLKPEQVSQEEILEAVRGRVDWHMRQGKAASVDGPALPVAGPVPFAAHNGVPPALPLPPSVEEKRHSALLERLNGIEATLDAALGKGTEGDAAHLTAYQVIASRLGLIQSEPDSMWAFARAVLAAVIGFAAMTVLTGLSAILIGRLP